MKSAREIPSFARRTAVSAADVLGGAGIYCR